MSIDSPAERLQPPKPLYLALYFVAVLGLYAYLNPGGSHLFWDAQVYARAIGDWRAHRDAYTAAEGLIFVYPPIFLWIAGALAGLMPEHWAWYLFIACHIAATLTLPLVLAQFYFRRAWLSVAFAYTLYVAEPGFAGLVSLRAGNLANIFYLLTLLAALPGLRRNRWGWFYAAAFLIGMVKIAFLLVLILPVFAGRRQWIKSALCGVAAAATYPLQRWIAPVSYRAFVAAANIQVGAHADYGYGILGTAATMERKLLHRGVDLLPFVVQAAFIVAIVVALYLLRRRLPEEAQGGVWLALLLTAIILCNPRIERYDSYVGLLAAFILLAEALQTRRYLLLLSAIFLPSMLTLYIRHRSHHVDAWGAYETLVLVVAFAAGYCWLWRSTPPARKPESAAVAN
ncbi:hypothetical protein HNQ77_001233 [Silvibacterium bohemicum]|uniref:DUF2029 domain-containing protein n=1 Tax=Silvibacterium bohemicum TaxID=1577686 RepID=A0A841JU66_9BACT|nr:DUF2029 domain-containing protein [Silvibacterium bohemicum]MBB6143289.1 hypothetical protein [Silvibacterium bohemicum]